jgi:hypothetical protein
MTSIVQPAYTTTGGNPSTDASGNTFVALATFISGESEAFDRTFGGALASYSNKTSDGSVKASAGVLYGIVCTASSSGVIRLFDNTAGSGTEIYNSVSAITAGAVISFPAGILFNTGLYFDLVSGTGTFNILYI